MSKQAFAALRPLPGKSGDMATNENRKAPLPGMLGQPEEQARPQPERQSGRQGLGLELPQLRLDGGGE
jgi:hypothetical protein